MFTIPDHLHYLLEIVGVYDICLVRFKPVCTHLCMFELDAEVEHAPVQDCANACRILLGLTYTYWTTQVDLIWGIHVQHSM